MTAFLASFDVCSRFSHPEDQEERLQETRRIAAAQLKYIVDWGNPEKLTKSRKFLGGYLEIQKMEKLAKCKVSNLGGGGATHKVGNTVTRIRKFVK